MNKAPTSSPNVVIVIVDDLAYGDLSCHGNPHIQTPALDQLHKESVRVTRYCSGPLCTPARAALMTGRHAYRTRALDTYLGTSVIDPNEITLAHLFQKAGYHTGLFGKWHLGDTLPSDPNSMGFGEVLCHTGGGLRQEGNYGRNSYFDPDLLHNGERITTQGYCSDVYTDAACDFIRSRTAPFFCYLAFNAIHWPLEIVEEWADPFRAQGLPEKWCRVYGMLKNLDENIGKLTHCLESEGIREDTLILFTSDHGPCGSANFEGRARYNCSLRGNKADFYEGGIKVPAFWSWRNTWTARDSEVLSNPIDILPTLSSVCGIQSPQDRKIDGVDLVSILSGETPESTLENRNFCMQWHRGARPIKGNNAACLGFRYKWYSLSPGTEELYDLLEDPYEQTDIHRKYPEISDDLRKQYHEWFDDVCAERQLLDLKKIPGVPIVLATQGNRSTILTWQDWISYSGQGGFSNANPGYWHVTVPEAGSYRILIDRSPRTFAAELHFRFGSLEKRVPPVGEVETLCFDIDLPALSSEFHCYFMQDGEKIGCQFVSIRKAKIK